MDQSHLEAFMAVCQTLNFTAAAKHLHISQSAVTARIRALEQAVGKRLFDRDNRTVSLTRAGIAFLPYAERMLQLIQESKLSLSEQYREHIVLSGPGSVWHYRYLNRILEFRGKNPHVAVKFLSYIDPGYMIRDLLLDGTVSLAIKLDPPDHQSISKQLLFEDEIILVSADGSTELLEPDFSAQTYCHIDWGNPFTEWFASLVEPGFIPALQTDHSSTMLTMLLSNSVFGFLPKSIADPYLQTNKIYQIPLSVESPVIKGYACYLTEKREQSQVRLALELLGVDAN
ncbi:LysR family transcriptional regulator [Paenibacillus sp. SC116]|uniref:LysR family transcriptional regulator n=1 Tax=Paenibacillus sp. SC116 TaxID=2968986 RepID=UPI00215A86EC|nr:LysR family transcriptional regulator [Paenibacillus sp. SC116]MCR8843618.1 LysR family transcriptional regulator [Paenibacillus sp. SC116]